MLRKILCDLNICDDKSIIEFFPNTRDNKNIKVLKCLKSNVIFLSKCDKTDYSNHNMLEYWPANDRQDAVEKTKEDTDRRFKQFSNLIYNKKWLDVGTGIGEILDAMVNIAKEIFAVEPQIQINNVLKDLGYNVFFNLDDIIDNDFDVITLFHVFEHFENPLVELKRIKNKLKKGGKVIIEVPHANDFLISFLDLDPFKEFTFWSEHLILHTKNSLEVFLKEAGFLNINIEGVQRYNFANHLYWLRENKPNGHVVWNILNNDRINTEYANLLINLGFSDTIVAIAEV